MGGRDGGAPRILYVEGARGRADFSRLEGEVEVVRERSPGAALARLESEGDFAVLICDEESDGSEEIELFERARSLAPTTVRLALGEDSERGVRDTLRQEAFRCIPGSSSPEELAKAIAEALDYHQLLATSPAQPVEPGRAERDAMPPPARRQRPSARRGCNEPRLPARGLPLDVRAPELIVLDRGTQRFGLQVVGRFVELLPGVTVVGRSRTCHIFIPDPQISRRHAAFSNTGREVTVRNVSHTNGLRVNGVLVERDVARALKVGDQIRLGSHEIELCGLGDYCPSLEPTDIVLRDETPEPTSRSTLLTLAQVANKYFVLGQTREAERILRPVLEGLLRHCGAGQKPSKSDLELATDLTLRIAEANHAGEWIDYLFQLFTRLGRPMSSQVIERLYRIIPESQGAKMACYRSYLDALSQLADLLGPDERFLVRRIQGLATPLQLSAHL
jgi:pSer/pThr/pTyr-binding forkhead associated (FHA) protein/CheY-like chemotaxis protein